MSKKLIVVMLALLSLASVIVPAFAQTNAAADSSGVTVTDNNTLDIPKGIILEGSLASVYSPNIVFTYEATPGEAASVTDAHDVTSVITPGVLAGITLGGDTDSNNATGAVTFTSSEQAVGQITQNLTLTFAPAEFPKPGVYRYKITDTTSEAALFAAGITRPADYDKEFFLDVYIKRGNAGQEVFGYVLMNDAVNPVNPQTNKSAGFIDPSDPGSGGGSGSTPAIAMDTYTTVDIQVTKQVTGSMGDVNHDFPFTIAINNNNLSYYGKEGLAATVDDDLSATSISAALHSGESYYLKGLSPKATISYTEQNDTLDTYTLTVKDSANANVKDNATTPADISGISMAPQGTKTTATLNVSNYPTDNSASSTSTAVAVTTASAVTFTNNLDEISPTGVVLRIAPFVFMLAAGAFLLFLSRRRKSAAENE